MYFQESFIVLLIIRFLKCSNKSSNSQDNENIYKLRLRSTGKFSVPKTASTFYTITFSFVAPRIFNVDLLPYKSKQFLNIFKEINKLVVWVRRHVFSLMYNSNLVNDIYKII